MSNAFLILGYLCILGATFLYCTADEDAVAAFNRTQAWVVAIIWPLFWTVVLLVHVVASIIELFSTKKDET